MWFTWGGKGPHHTLFCRGNIKGELHIKTMNTAWLLGCFYDWAIVICAIVQKKLVFEFTKQLFGLLGSCPAHVFFSSRPANIQISKPKWLRLSITRWWRSRQSKKSFRSSGVRIKNHWCHRLVLDCLDGQQVLHKANWYNHKTKLLCLQRRINWATNVKCR